MNTRKIIRFAEATALVCPFCQQSLTLVETSLKCPQKHSFDIAKFGYVNLAPQVKQSKDYDKDNFQNRQTILEAGFYDHILQALLDKLEEFPDKHRLLDVGCGEGYYAREIQTAFPHKSIYAFDLSKESVQLAAKSDATLAVKWFVGDLTKLPIQTASIDLILDIFSPAHYQEFQRVLAPDGLVIKVLPTTEHLQEIRQLANAHLTKKDYSNQEIFQHFEKDFTILQSQEVKQTFPLSDSQKNALLAMTPLLFHVPIEEIDWSALTEITIGAQILVGRSKREQ